ncbi:hypothetical protein [Iodobacter ciconiae]|uniref:Carboxypeptidase regulatory-like domain-containing protein n=1 Tax=Iodobacter ciconiae TaxID=2496266 RepID=A0A3S8ZNM2_9NEIS|nr:hypothetical protein [Iodobacter ciconiae]AZN35157.1 hypothetical protein EJO50_00845 [Iodobacter ciconiae]
MFKSLILSCVLFLSACASVPVAVMQGRLAPPVGQGYVVVALTLNSFDQDGANAWLRLEGSQGRADLNASILHDTITAPNKNATGKLHILSLPPGQYTAVSAVGYWRYTAAGWPQQRHEQLPIGQSFEVKAGEVIYLGEVHLALNFQSSLIISDQHERDFYALGQQYGISDTSNIKTRLLSNPVR